jgi:hypothetical protein
MKRFTKLLAVLLATTACDSPTDTESFALRADPAIQSQKASIKLNSDGTPFSYSCRFPISLIAEGGVGKDKAILQVGSGSRQYAYPGGTSTVPISVSNAQLQGWFGADELRAGSKLSAIVEYAYYGAPPSTTIIDIAYLDSKARLRSTTVTFSCL